jgi:hypothetical protein
MNKNLKEIFEQLEKEELITFELLAVQLHKKSIPLIVFICTLPFMQPIPLPGISSLVAFVIALQGLAMIFMNRPWLTKKMKSFVIPKDKFKIFYHGFLKVNFYLEKFVTPRFVHFFHMHFSLVISGLFIFILAIFLSLPLPIPFSNFIPAFGIMLLSIGILTHDFIVWIIGFVWSLLVTLLFVVSSKEISLILNQMFR